MALYSQLGPEQQTQVLARVNSRWSQLHALEKEWGEKAYKYLLLTNTGGAIATLSFLGTASKALDTSWARWALCAFVAGVLMTGVALAHKYHNSANLFWDYRADANLYLDDKMEWKNLWAADVKRSVKRGGWALWLPYACLLTFWSGCIIGAVAILKAVP